jgi:hypothetical protein
MLGNPLVSRTQSFQTMFSNFKKPYGLKQALRAWYERLTLFLLEKGFKMGLVEKTLFLLKQGNDTLLV